MVKDKRDWKYQNKIFIQPNKQTTKQDNSENYSEHNFECEYLIK